MPLLTVFGTVLLALARCVVNPYLTVNWIVVRVKVEDGGMVMTEHQQNEAIKLLKLFVFKGEYEGRPSPDQIDHMARWLLIDIGAVDNCNAPNNNIGGN